MIFDGGFIMTFHWPWLRKSDERKEDGRPLSPQEMAALDMPVTHATVVRVVEMLAVKADRKEIALRRDHRRSTMLRWAAFMLMLLVAISFIARVWQAQPEPVRMKSSPFKTIALAGNSGVAHVAFIPINGSIGGDKYGEPDIENTEWYVQNALELAAGQKNISAIILNITSYGGDAVASAHGYRMIKQFRERTKIPVVALIRDYAYSGGYYLALGANEIVIDPDASLGSVGVIMSWFSTAAIGKMFDVGTVNIMTGPLKSCIGQWVELTPACRASFERSVDVTFKRFLLAMSDSRNIPLETLISESKSNTGRTNGGTFVAEDAVSLQMADRSESDDELFERIARDIAKKNPKLKSVEFVQYNKQQSLISGLSSSVSSAAKSIIELMSTATSLIQVNGVVRAK